MGQSPESTSYNSDKQGVPFYQGNADFGALYPNPRIWCNKPIKLAKENDILISVRAPVGALNFSKEECCIGRGLAAITLDSNDFLLEFIYWSLRTGVKELQNKSTGSTFKSINKKTLEEVRIPKVPLKEQKDIIRNLTLLTNILAKYKHEIVFLDKLVKARFVEMFGDLKTNSKGWDIVGFKDCANIDTNMVHDFRGYEDYPHIGIDSIEKETGRLAGYRTISEDKVVSGKYLFTPNHIIYSKIRPNLNKVALPEFMGLCSADAYPILVKEGVCNREYLAFTLRSKCFLDYILAFSNRTNLPKVNKKQVENFVLPLPPLELQNQFASFVQEIDKSRLHEHLSIEYIKLLLKDY